MNEEMYDQAESALKHSWEIHKQVFGTILEPAFKDDPQVRISLIAALNHISHRDIKRGMEVLYSIKNACICNEDKAAWAFCVGLSFDMIGAKKQMTVWYKEAEKYGHGFYLPYLKIAKTAHENAKYDEAHKYYMIAIDCLKKNDFSSNKPILLASAYSNHISCLTMMHRYKDAELELNNVSSIMPESISVAAVLYAAIGNADMVSNLLKALKAKLPELGENTEKMTELILMGAHPHFSVVPVEPFNISTFWNWFCENSSCIDEKSLSEQLIMAFPFMNREPGPEIRINGSKKMIVFHDFYAVGLHYGYSQLIRECPAEISDEWTFTIVH